MGQSPDFNCRRWSDLRFDNRYLQQLPSDALDHPGRRQVFEACHSRVSPTPVAAPVLLAHSDEALSLLGLPPAAALDPRFVEVLSGNGLLDGMQPYANCYGGHQFGHWAGQLGDGRAISLGQAVGSQGQHWELQLKGAGPTPYSRTADGRAVLRSSLREFVCSEAMHHLGVPTTRALSLIGTGEPVLRDMFYDGNAAHEPGAVVCRMAPSFIRFGTFELPASRKDIQTLTRLLDFTLEHHFPQCGPPGPESYGRLYAEVCRRTAALVTHFMRVGFVHGVLNTDNMSIHGLCIDYGPYGFLDGYEPGFTPNTTDAQGKRYCYGRQPQMAGWNLARLGEALLLVVDDTAELQRGLDDYSAELNRHMRDMHQAKVGLSTYDPDTDDALREDMHQHLQQQETDFTLFYRGLAAVGEGMQPGAATDGTIDNATLFAPIAPAYYHPPCEQTIDNACRLLRRLLSRVQTEGRPEGGRRAAMRKTNPKYIFRNYLAQQAIDRATAGDNDGIAEVLDVLRRPYDEQPGRQTYADKRPEWARHKAGCSMLSCSS